MFSAAAICACIWVFAATFTAFLPMKRQYAPGLVLLFLAPFLIGWLWVEHGWIVGVLSLLGFVSMFRNPLKFLAKKALGS